jgi:hypothetical protein
MSSSRLTAVRKPHLLVLLSLATATAAQAQPHGPLPGPLPLFPLDNWWNIDISSAPVDDDSADYLGHSSIGLGENLHPDFGGEDEDNFPAIYGMVYVSVPGNQPLQTVAFVEFGSQSDAGAPGRPVGYPIPEEATTQPGAPGQPHWIEGGAPGNVANCPDGDRHMLLVDRDNRLLYELYHTCWDSGQNRWEAGSGAILSLDGNNARPDTWTSADASGMAILPGLVRYDEAMSGQPIRHAFRATVNATNGYVFPASHEAGDTAGALPMGARLRLKSETDISAHPDYIQRIFQAMKTYGLIIADNGSSIFVQGTHDTRWDNGELNPAFHGLLASDFEVIELGWHPSTAVAPAARDFFTVPPCRLVDTRLAPGPSEPASSGAPALYPGQGYPGEPAWSRVFRAAGQCGVPATAKAVSLNVTVVAATSGGFFTIYPGDHLAAPVTSTVSFGVGQTRATNVVVALSASGSGTVAVQNNSTALATLVVDVNGYFE